MISEVLVELLIRGGIDAYQAYREQGMSAGAARDATVAEYLRRFREGDEDLTAALEGKPPATLDPLRS